MCISYTYTYMHPGAARGGVEEDVGGRPFEEDIRLTQKTPTEKRESVGAV